MSMVGSEAPPPQRVQLPKEELERLSKEELIAKWKEQESYVEYLESQAGSSAASSQELVSLRESEEKLKQQQLEATRRENVLVMRLTTKEQEMQECAHQIQELKGASAATGWTRQLRAALLDPAVNLLFERMRREVEAMRTRLEETQNELSAWKFTPDRCPLPPPLLRATAPTLLPQALCSLSSLSSPPSLSFLLSPPCC